MSDNKNLAEATYKMGRGQKSTIIPVYPSFPERIEYYIEPFLGGVLYFYLLPSRPFL